MWAFVAAGVVLVFFLAVIWLGGWFFGLALAVKIVLSVMLVGFVAVLLAVRYLLRLDAARQLQAGLVEQGQQQANNARPDKRPQILELQRQAMEAIGALKRSRLGRGGSSALYALPWYVIVGPTGAGKTTAIKASGLDFPLTRTSGVGPVKGFGGTRHCDWFFTNEAILLDTAGRYTLTAEDEEWFAFLDLLRKTRPRKPIDGLLVALPIPDLTLGDPVRIAETARLVRTRLDEVTTRLKMLVPVYVLFTKVDQVPGFREFFDVLRPSEREQAWGMTFPLKGQAEPKERFAREFAVLRTALYGRMVRHLSTERRAGVRRAFWNFPTEMAALEGALGTFLAAAFQTTAFQETPVLRGVYFTSGTQNEKPISRLLASMANSARLQLPRATVEVAGEAKSFFLADVFRKVIFPDRHVAAISDGEKRRQLLLRIGVAALATTMAASLFLPASITWLRNRQLLASTNDIATAVRGVNWSDAGALERNMPRLDAAKSRLQEGGAWNQDGPPAKLRWGMYVGEELYAALRGLYLAPLARAVVLPTKRDLEERLRGMDAGPIRTSENFNRDFDTLKLYLMLGDPKHVDAAWAAPRLVRDWGRLRRTHAEAEETLVLPHVAYVFDLLARGELPSFELDQALVARTRSILAQVPQMDRLYESLVRDANTELPGVRREMIFHGDVAPFVQSRSGVRVAGAYTKPGWARVRTLLGEERAKLAGEQWVLGDVADANAAATVNKLRALYFERYQNAWRDFLLDLEVRDPGNAEVALVELNALSEPEWPYLRLVRVLAENVALDVEEGDDRGLMDKAVDKAKDLVDGGAPARKRAVSPVERTFRPIVKFGLPPDGVEGAPAATGLAQYQALLAKLVGALTDLRDAEAGADPRKVSDVFQDAVRGAAALLSEQDGFTRPLLSPLLMNPISLAYRNVVRDAGAAAGATWEASVWQKWHDKLEGKYPFAQVNAEAPLNDFMDFFAPGNGVLWSFYDETLKPTLDRNGTSFVPSRRFKSALGYTPEFLDVCLKRGQEMTTVLFPPKTAQAAVTFEVNLHSVSSSVGEVTFEVDGTGRTYRNEPEQWLSVTWPGKAPRGARLRVRGAGGLSEEIARTGDFGLFRVLDAADVKPGRAGAKGDGTPTLIATWDLRAIGSGAFVSMDIRPSRNENPLVPGYFKGYNCPRLITR